MGHQHEGGEVDNLFVKVEVACNTPVEHLFPLINILTGLRGIKADAVAPEVKDFPQLKLQVFKLGLSRHLMRVHAEIQVELIEVSFDVYALQGRVRVLVHQHEVRVDFKAAVYSEGQTDLVAFLRTWVNLGDRSELEKG